MEDGLCPSWIEDPEVFCDLPETRAWRLAGPAASKQVPDGRNTWQNKGSFENTVQAELMFHENKRRYNLFSESNFIIS